MYIHTYKKEYLDAECIIYKICPIVLGINITKLKNVQFKMTRKIVSNEYIIATLSILNQTFKKCNLKHEMHEETYCDYRRAF